MRLGSETNSVSNWQMAGWVGGPKPEVGMGATMLFWTDRVAGTITRMSPSGKTLEVQEDKATLTSETILSESQTYAYEPNPKGIVRCFRLGKHGWREVGSKGRGTALHLGTRESYRDPSF